MTAHDTVLRTPDAQTDPDQTHALASYHKTLNGKGVSVSRLELTADGDVELEYTIRPGTADEQAKELQYIAGSYLPEQEAGGFGDLQVTAHSARSSESGATWFVDEEWAQKHHDDEWTDEEYLKAVYQTLKR